MIAISSHLIDLSQTITYTIGSFWVTTGTIPSHIDPDRNTTSGLQREDELAQELGPQLTHTRDEPLTITRTMWLEDTELATTIDLKASRRRRGEAAEAVFP